MKNLRMPYMYKCSNYVSNFSVVTTRKELSCDEDIPNTYTWKTINIADMLIINSSIQKIQHVFTSVTQT